MDANAAAPGPSGGQTAAAAAAPAAVPARSDIPQPPPGLVVAPTSWTPPTAPQRPARSPLVWVVAGLFGAIAALGASRMLGSDPVALPDTVLGQPKMTGAQIDAVVESLEDIRVLGQRLRAAVYGSGTPTLMIVATDVSSLADPEQPWNAVADGAGAGGGTIDQGARETATIDGVYYICAPVVEMAWTVCRWTDDRATGFVADYTVADPNAGITRTQSVYEVVVADLPLVRAYPARRGVRGTPAPPPRWTDPASGLAPACAS